MVTEFFLFGFPQWRSAVVTRVLFVAKNHFAAIKISLCQSYERAEVCLECILVRKTQFFSTTMQSDTSKYHAKNITKVATIEALFFLRILLS